jgi:hypothetical protein
MHPNLNSRIATHIDFDAFSAAHTTVREGQNLGGNLAINRFTSSRFSAWNLIRFGGGFSSNLHNWVNEYNRVVGLRALSDESWQKSKCYAKTRKRETGKFQHISSQGFEISKQHSWFPTSWFPLKESFPIFILQVGCVGLHPLGVTYNGCKKLLNNVFSLSIPGGSVYTICVLFLFLCFAKVYSAKVCSAKV